MEKTLKKQMKIVNFTLLHVAHGRAHLTATVYTPTCFDVGFYLCIIILLIYYLLLFIICYLFIYYLLLIQVICQRSSQCLKSRESSVMSWNPSEPLQVTSVFRPCRKSDCMSAKPLVCNLLFTDARPTKTMDGPLDSWHL